MNLIIDIGNTSAKLTLFKNKKIIRQSNVESCELTRVKDFVSSEVIESSIISSSKEITVEISRIIETYNGFILNDKTGIPIINKYKTLENLLKRYELTSRGKREIIKAAQQRSTTCSVLNRLARKILFKESITNKNKEL